MRLFSDREEVAGFDDLIRRYPASELHSPTRSTVPLLALLKVSEAAESFLRRGFGLDLQGLEAHFEYTVRPLRGTGEASHTDAMLISGVSALALEAKWTEPPYETVAVWLKKGGQNRVDVMEGWLSALQRHAKQPLALAAFGDARYQMVHRAASACAAGENAVLVYVQFRPLPGGAPVTHFDQLRGDLEHLFGLLGKPTRLPFITAEIELEPTSAFEGISTLRKGLPETGERVREALLSAAPLFRFGKVCMRVVM